MARNMIKSSEKMVANTTNYQNTKFLQDQRRSRTNAKTAVNSKKFMAPNGKRMNAGINGIIDKIDSYTNAKAQDRFT